MKCTSVLLCLCVSYVCLVFVSDARAGTACENLTTLTLHEIKIKSATPTAAGLFTPPGARSPISLPAFCRVIGVATPTPESNINFEVWIPPADAWNGKFQGVGNGGFQGSISYDDMASALRRGYATASTDTGHIGDDLRFAEGHPERIVDWATRSIHLMTEAAKAIIRDHAGRFPDRSYFYGCNTGGHQALMEAQRFPTDYDGIVAGAPAADRVHEIIGYLGVWKSTHENDSSLLSQGKLQLLTASAVASCDQLDGVKDGVIDDPRRCKFDPAAVLCRNSESESCLTRPEVEAAKKVYSGVHNPRTGELIFPGWPVGSEGFGDNANSGWGQMINIREPRRVGFFNYFVFNDPNWDWRTFDFDRDLAYADKKMGFISATDRNLTAFKLHGGKLLMYAGWVDPILPAEDVVEYYEGATKTMGGAAKTTPFFRLFMAPGMGHCAGGPGPTAFDMMPALEQWVEKGLAPEKVVASRVTNGKVERTRPLCPYPQVARWKGTGSTDDAANFVCVNSGARPTP